MLCQALDAEIWQLIHLGAGLFGGLLSTGIWYFNWLVLKGERHSHRKRAKPHPWQLAGTPVEFESNPNRIWFYEEKVLAQFITYCQFSIKNIVLTQVWRGSLCTDYQLFWVIIQMYRYTGVQIYRYTQLSRRQHVSQSRFVPYWQVADDE